MKESEREEGLRVLRIASCSTPNSVTGALETYGCNEVHAIGASAINQIVKGIAIALSRRTRSSRSRSFMKLSIVGDEKTGIRFIIEKQYSSPVIRLSC
ncbi:stage V sporulation protein S [Candidatus Bipolaricaulota bacterium]|nr:stage V sporulation protein S [Candidatus Bipolaricaulota bacterium]